MIDYEELYVQVMYYLKDSDLCQSMGEAALHAEQITENIQKLVEEELSNGKV